MPEWGGDLSKIDFQNIFYYARLQKNKVKVGMMCQNL